MTPAERERYRWEFAGRAMQGFISHNPMKTVLHWNYIICVEHADDLIAALEKTAPKECEHTSNGTISYVLRCSKCGEPI